MTRMPLTLRSGLFLPLLFAVALACAPPAAQASGAWSTYIKMVTTRDIIALSDTVWLATGEAGLLRYLRSSDTFESVYREPGGLASNNVTTLAFDRSRRLWAGTQGKGVSRLSANGSTWDLVNAFDGLPSDSVTVLRADGDTIWIGTTRGIALWSGSQIAGAVPDLGTASPFRDNRVTGIVVAGDSLFVATGDGVFLARLSQNLATWTEESTGLPAQAIDGLAIWNRQPFALAAGQVYAWSPSGGAWSSTGVPGGAEKLRDDYNVLLAISPFGLYRWDGLQWNATPAAWGSGSGAQFSEMAADPAGVLFETHAQALLQQTGATWVTHFPQGPAENDVQNVLHDGTRLWAMTFSGGVSRLDASGWRNFKPGCCGLGQDTSFIAPAFAFAAQLDLTGHVWTSTWGAAIERIDPATSPMTFLHACVATGVNGDTLAPHTWGWSSAVDGWNYVYIGGDTPDRGTLEPAGIDVYTPAAQRLINWKTTNTGMPGNQVRAIAVDKYRQLWAGFAQAGVAWTLLDSVSSVPATPSVNDHLRLPAFHVLGALATSDIFGIVAHGDSLWVLTTSELQRIRPTTRVVSAHYDIPAGPAPRGAVHLLDVAPDGTVWVGSVDGVRRYMPGGGSQDYRIDNSPLADNEVRSVYVERATGAVWIGTASGVNRFDPHYQPPRPPPIPQLTLKAWPNPARLYAMGLQLRLSANSTTLSGEVIDLGGRVMRRFPEMPSGGVVWDGRDSNGALVRPGVYFVHAHGGGHEAMTRVVVLR